MFLFGINRVGNLGSIDKTLIVDPTMGGGINVVRNRGTHINALPKDPIQFRISYLFPIVRQDPAPVEMFIVFPTPHNRTQDRRMVASFTKGHEIMPRLVSVVFTTNTFGENVINDRSELNQSFL